MDPWPLAHRLNDFDLEDRIVQDFGWDPEHRFSHMKYLKGLLKINNEDVREQHDNDPSSISDEGIRAKYFIDMMITGIDYRTHNLFSEMISKEQRKVIKGKFPSLIAMQETEELACNGMKVSQDFLTDNIWIGDTGASCHMRSSLKGMYDLRKGKGGIKVGSGKVIPIKNIGSFRGEIVQKDGSRKKITLKNVHYVPKMYCNLFSITTAMDEGCTIGGGNGKPLTLKKEYAVIMFDRNIKSG